MSESTISDAPISTDANPYLAPESELIDENQTSSIRIFKRFSAWFVFILNFLSLGIYSYIWQYLRSRTLNTFTEDKVPEPFMAIVLFLYFASLTLTIYAIFQPVPVKVLEYNGWFSYPLMFLNVFWSFMIRSRLLTLLSAEKTFGLHISGFLTFFFGPIYLQYKINEGLDAINDKIVLPVNELKIEPIDPEILKIDGIDFSEYSKHELMDSLSKIDQQKYPERAKVISRALAQYQS